MELRRIAAYLYARNKRFDESVELSKKVFVGVCFVVAVVSSLHCRINFTKMQWLLLRNRKTMVCCFKF
jgi:hypothetical protein